MSVRMRIALWAYGVVLCCTIPAVHAVATVQGMHRYVLKAGDPSLQVWLLPDTAPSPPENPTTPEKAKLGEWLFFDTRFSRTGMMSCATCHNPQYGWSDATPSGVGIFGQVTPRATLTVLNAGFMQAIMWDGRMKSLEEQAEKGFLNPDQNAVNFPDMILFLQRTPGYPEAFEKAFPGQAISVKTISQAVAAFERTLVSNRSPFDAWVKGDEKAMTAQQVRGFRLFLDKKKGNCEICHAAPLFSDDGFHNIGVKTPPNKAPDWGRYRHIPLPAAKGAFKTATLRDIALTAPYMHDGSEATLEDVMAFYARHGDDQSFLDPEMYQIHLNAEEQADIVAFMLALTTPTGSHYPFPVLPPTRHTR